MKMFTKKLILKKDRMNQYFVHVSFSNLGFVNFFCGDVHDIYKCIELCPRCPECGVQCPSVILMHQHMIAEHQGGGGDNDE